MGAVVCINSDQETPRNVTENQKIWHGNQDISVSRELGCDDFFCLAAEKRDTQNMQSPPDGSSWKGRSCDGRSVILKESDSNEIMISMKHANRVPVFKRNECLLVNSQDRLQDNGSSKLKSLKPLPISIQILLSAT